MNTEFQPLEKGFRKLVPHPYADLFPRYGQDELRKLADSILLRGQLEPIWVLEGKVLDGVNRQDACVLAGVQPRYEDYAGDDPLGFVLAKNDERRHLDPAQRAMVAVKLDASRKEAFRAKNSPKPAPAARPSKAAEPKAAPADSPPAVPKASMPTLEQSARQMRVSVRVAQQAKNILEQGVPELQQAVERGEVDAKHAEVVAKLPAARQQKIVAKGAKAIKEAARQAARDLKEQKKEVVAHFGHNPYSAGGGGAKKTAKSFGGELGRLIADTDALIRRFTDFVRSEAGEDFADRVKLLELGWIDFSRERRLDVADDGTVTRHGSRFVAMRELRRLLVASYTGAKYPVKQMLEMLQHQGENDLDADGPPDPEQPAQEPQGG